MKLAWITGANGLIGNYLVQTAPKYAAGWRVRPLTRDDFDLLDFGALEREIRRDRPQLVIHCAAISTTAQAQKEPELTRRVNVELTQYLAGLAADAAMIFFSSDLVFDGRKGDYTETDAANPLHLYGETKLAAEQAVLAHTRHLVIRTSINGGVSRAGDRAFNEQLRRTLENAGPGMTLFTDEIRCPIPALETARATWELAGKNSTGLYHVAGAERLTRMQIGEMLVRRWGRTGIKLNPGLAKDFPGPPRALDTSLNILKAQGVLSRPLPGLSEWLREHPEGEF